MQTITIDHQTGSPSYLTKAEYKRMHFDDVNKKIGIIFNILNGAEVMQHKELNGINVYTTDEEFDQIVDSHTLTMSDWVKSKIEEAVFNYYNPAQPE